MFKKRDRNEVRVIRHARVRKKISGSSETPRLSVYRSNKHIQAQYRKTSDHSPRGRDGYGF